MKVLFIGGTGIISEAVSKMAVQKGIELYLLNRGQHKEFAPPGINFIYSDIRDTKHTAEVLKDYSFDVAVDWIAFTPEHIRTDIELFKGKVGQFIFISSASAYQKPPQHYLITEATPLENPYWQYSRDKIACEEILMEEYRSSGFPCTIVRPSLTYGKTMIPASMNSWQKPWSIIDRMKKGKKIIIPGDGTSLWVVTHNTDFARGFIGLLGNKEAVGQAFHITTDEVLTWDQIYWYIADAAGLEPQFVHISSDFICAVSPDHIGPLLGDKSVSAVFDNSKIKKFVPDFKAVIPFSEGIRESIKWFEANPEHCIIDEEWHNQMDMIIEKYVGAYKDIAFNW